MIYPEKNVDNYDKELNALKSDIATSLAEREPIKDGDALSMFHYLGINDCSAQATFMQTLLEQQANVDSQDEDIGAYQHKSNLGSPIQAGDLLDAIERLA